MSTTLTRIGLFLLPIIVSLGFVLAEDMIYYVCSTDQSGPYQVQNGCGGEADLMIYMNGNGPIAPGSLTHTYSVEYVNYGPSTASDIVITLEGLLYNTGFQIASGFNGPIYSGIVEGSSIQRTDTLAMNESGNFDFLIIHPHDGVYVYTASIASIDTTDPQTGDNSFTVNTTIDTVTQTPTIISPSNESTYVNNTGMSISFILPEILLSNSLQLSFVPAGDLSGATITMQLMDANPSITNTFTITPNNILSAIEVLSANTGSIPNGTYDIILSYQDVFGNPAANTIVNDVTIIDTPTPYVLTQVTQVPSTISSNTALYVFSFVGTGLADVIATPCGRGSEIKVSDPGLSTTVQVEISLLEAGRTYACQIAFRSLGDVYSNRLDIGPFTVRSSGGGGSASSDYCPYGDTSGSYYDGNCGTEKSLVEKIVAKLTHSWASRSTEKIQGMLMTLTLLNNKIQAIDSVSTNMKQLFQSIVDGLIEHYSS